MEPNSDASVWQCKLLDGATFHDGKPFVAEDVVFTFQYWWDPKTKSQAKPQLEGVVKPENIRAVDDLTVEFTLDSPNSFFPGIMADRATKIMSSGTTIESNGTKPNGTGPFKFVTWTRGERCEMERFENYHVSGRPYLDELTTFSINEPTARLNALVAGQVDALSQLAPQLAGTVEGNEALTLIEKTGGTFTCQYMDMSKPPFQSNDVRQAFRYMVDREQIIETALGGRGELGNDLPSWFDEDYASDIPQREYDPERAKSLLEKAGMAGLTVDLNTSDVAPAMTESSTLIAEQAKAVGVTINIKKTPADQYYTGPYLKTPFACTSWGGRPMVTFFGLALVSNAPYNETQWKRPAWDRQLLRAYAEPEEAARHEILVDLQQQLWDEGGYIIWGFPNTLDATSSKVKGIVGSVIRPLQYYDFSGAYFE
jgi:peptide/nickel transport system substrate-binding protein